MKKLIIAFTFVMFCTASYAQSNKGLCKVEVSDIIPIVTFGYLVSYDLNVENNSNKTVKGVDWTAYFYSQDGALIKKISDSYSSGKIIDPIAPGYNKNLIRAPRVKGAAKMSVTITKVVFHDGSVCK
jgi:hypothetical protein